MRVAYLGNFRHSFCTEAYVATALRENGCDVIELQLDDVHPNQFVPNMLAADVDLVLYTRIHNHSALPPSWTELCWRPLHDAGVTTASLHLDRFWDLEREHYIHDRDPLFWTQHVFTADGGNDERWKYKGINHHWMPPAVARSEAVREGQRRPRFEFDVVFVGSTATYHGEYPERLDLIRFLRDRYGTRFATFGNGADFPVVREQDLSDLYASARVIVGDSCFANSPASHGPRLSTRYWSDRIPETLGRGGFLIHPWLPGLSEHFETGRHLVTHIPGDWEDLDAQIGAYLAAPGEAYGIAVNGREHVLRAHTWTVRVRELLCTVGLGECAEAAA